MNILLLDGSLFSFPIFTFKETIGIARVDLTLRNAELLTT